MAGVWLAVLISLSTGVLLAVDGQMPPPVMEVPVGATVVMPCPSNDDRHIFQFWQTADDHVLGPANLPDRDKYKFDVPSGTLYIRALSSAESGFYKCISKNVDNKRLIVRTVELIVRRNPEALEDTIFETTLFRGLLSVGVVLVLLLIGILMFIIFRKRGRRTSKFAGAVDEEAYAEGAAKNGTYNPTTVPISLSQKPSTSQGVDNPAMETDFPRVFQSQQRPDGPA